MRQIGQSSPCEDAAVESWAEADSELYRRLAPVAVPARQEQIATLVCLIPYGEQDEFVALDLGCGEGALGYCLLSCFPRARLIAFDGSTSMRHAAARLLAPFGGRARVEPFDLASEDWLPLAHGAGAVVSSLALHHLSGEDKRRLFDRLAERLGAGAGFLIADLIEPQRAEAGALFAASWDRAARLAADALGSTAAFEAFVKAEWNLYRYPDPVDRPSPLCDQLRWREEAGFADVDCFWLQAGHTIYGGYLPGGAAAREPVLCDRALEAAGDALKALGQHN